MSWLELRLWLRMPSSLLTLLHSENGIFNITELIYPLRKVRLQLNNQQLKEAETYRKSSLPEIRTENLIKKLKNNSHRIDFSLASQADQDKVEELMDIS
jgi:hypothetical protein